MYTKTFFLLFLAFATSGFAQQEGAEAIAETIDPTTQTLVLGYLECAQTQKILGANIEQAAKACQNMIETVSLMVRRTAGKAKGAAKASRSGLIIPGGGYGGYSSRGMRYFPQQQRRRVPPPQRRRSARTW